MGSTSFTQGVLHTLILHCVHFPSLLSLHCLLVSDGYTIGRGAHCGALPFVEKKTVVLEADAETKSGGSSEVSKERMTTPEPKV